MMVPTFEILPRSPFRQAASGAIRPKCAPTSPARAVAYSGHPFRKIDNSASFESTCSLFRQGLEENLAMEIARYRLFESFAFNGTPTAARVEVFSGLSAEL